MAVPQQYRTGPTAIATYAFTDIISKVGYNTFYAVGGNDGTIAFSPLQVESDAEYVNTGDSSDSGNVAEISLDIDLEFKTLQTIKGKMFVCLTYGASNGNGVAATSAFAKVRVYHYDGSTLTEIGTQQTTDTITTSGVVPDIQYTRQTCVFDIARKVFSPSHKLRVNVELWGTINTNGSIAVYHDGANRDITGANFLGENVPTDLKCIVPFEVDI